MTAELKGSLSTFTLVTDLSAFEDGYAVLALLASYCDQGLVESFALDQFAPDLAHKDENFEKALELLSALGTLRVIPRN